MIPYHLRPQAQLDLEDIADYTFENWGADQEIIYLQMIERAFRSLSDNPHLGRPFDIVTNGLRKLTVGRHFVLYFSRDTHVDIVRILHQSMDIDRHFDDL